MKQVQAFFERTGRVYEAVKKANAQVAERKTLK